MSGKADDDRTRFRCGGPIPPDRSIADFIAYIAGCPMFPVLGEVVTVFDPKSGLVLVSNAGGLDADPSARDAPSAPSIFDFVPVDSHEAFRATLHSLAERACAFESLEFALLDDKGRPVRHHHRLVLMDCTDGLVAVLLSTGESELTRALEQLQQSERRYELALIGSTDGIWDWRIGTSDVRYSIGNRRMLGYSAEEFPDTFEAWSSRVHPSDLERVLSLIHDHARATTEQYDAVYRIRAANGSWRWWRSRGRVFEDEDGEPAHMIGSNSDITDLMRARLEADRAAEALRARNAELSKAKRRIEHAATHDALTGLPNRHYLSAMAQRLVRETTSSGHALAAIQIDLDGFKQVNDTLGHAAGDALLKSVSRELENVLGPDEFLARSGGDEFVILSRNASSESRLERMADTIVKRLSRPFDHEGRCCRIGASVGVAVAREAPIDSEKLLIQADMALYRAKSHGRGRAVLFSDAIEEEHTRRHELEEEVRHGLDRGEFEPHFQPQFFASDLALAGVEALVRWKHPTRGTLAPVSFLGVVNDLGLIARLDHMVLEKANRCRCDLRDVGLPIPQLSVNVSMGRLCDPLLFETIGAIHLDPGSIAFEMLESVFLDQRDPQIDEAITRLRESGIAIELDDFGTGHTSIVSLLTLRPDRIKLDRQLISKIAEDAHKRTLVRSIIDMARALGIGVLAEGVEHPSEVAILRELNCEVLQGYALARPMTAEALRSFLGERKDEGLPAAGRRSQPVGRWLRPGSVPSPGSSP